MDFYDQKNIYSIGVIIWLCDIISSILFNGDFKPIFQLSQVSEAAYILEIYGCQTMLNYDP